MYFKLGLQQLDYQVYKNFCSLHTTTALQCTTRKKEVCSSPQSTMSHFISDADDESATFEASYSEMFAVSCAPHPLTERDTALVGRERRWQQCGSGCAFGWVGRGRAADEQIINETQFKINLPPATVSSFPPRP